MTEDRFKIEVLSLSKRLYPMALRYLGNNEAARDAVQQGMLKLWEKRESLDRYQNVTAFVFTVVRNICLDELKKKRPVLSDDLTMVYSGNHDQLAQHDAQEAVLLIGKIISKLPQLQQEVISMYDVNGLDYDEIAEILNIEVTYARVLLSRARKQVREQLEKIYRFERNTVKQ